VKVTCFTSAILNSFLSNGKSKKWISRKMKIGGLLLTLTAASCNGGGGEVMCYDTVEINSMWMHANGQNGIEIMLDTNNVLIGSISETYGSEFSFAVIDKDENKIQAGNIIPVDGKFNDFRENFKIELNKNLNPGDYALKLFTTGIGGQDTISPRNNFKLIIKNE